MSALGSRHWKRPQPYVPESRRCRGSPRGSCCWAGRRPSRWRARRPFWRCRRCRQQRRAAGGARAVAGAGEVGGRGGDGVVSKRRRAVARHVLDYAVLSASAEERRRRGRGGRRGCCQQLAGASPRTRIVEGRVRLRCSGVAILRSAAVPHKVPGFDAARREVTRSP